MHVKGWIRSDSVGFARTSPLVGRCCCAAPISRPGHRPASPRFQPGPTRTQKLPGSAPAPGAAADALVRRPERVRASSPTPPRAQSLKPSLSAVALAKAEACRLWRPMSKNPDGLNPSAAGRRPPFGPGPHRQTVSIVHQLPRLSTPLSLAPRLQPGDGGGPRKGKPFQRFPATAPVLSSAFTPFP